ncbi:hypothetical protein Gpo141_00015039, partial [Globisporangium polare]
MSSAMAAAHKKSIGRLYYFDQRGRAEVVRLVCAYGRVPLDEVEEPRGREFLARKPAFPFGKLPMMEIQGQLYAQSMALARYAAKQVGLYPRDSDLDALKVDMILDACADIHVPVLRATVAEKDPEQRDKQLKFIAKHTLPEILRGLHAHIGGDDNAEKNKGPFFLGEQISVADIAAFDVLTNALLPKQKDLLPIDYARDFPKLLELVERVGG